LPDWLLAGVRHIGMTLVPLSLLAVGLGLCIKPPAGDSRAPGPGPGLQALLAPLLMLGWPYSASPTPVWWRRSPYSRPPCRPWSWGAYWPPRTAWTRSWRRLSSAWARPCPSPPSPVAAGPFCLVNRTNTVLRI
jgi:hypothetical protein